MYRIGVDLGGTKIAVASISENNEIIRKLSTPTEPERGNNAVAEDIARLIKQLCADDGIKPCDVSFAGIAAPGAINPETGYIERAHNLDMEHFPIVDMVKELCGIDNVKIENDANAAALGEAVAGAAKGTKYSVMITLGTGVGGGFIIDGHVFSGFNYTGGEFGHMVICAGGRPCNCGRRGCWEAYSSATALVAMTREAMEAHPESELHKVAAEQGKVSGKTAFIASRRGDAAALAVVDEYVSKLACGIVNVINLLQPDVLSIGGGISNEGDGLMIPLQKQIDREIFIHGMGPSTEIRIAKLGNDAGLIGAANL
ncbi:MAG: ROK family protein [Clostridia bacterium]|nr:ROK family protein [Clostridia bacterium]